MSIKQGSVKFFNASKGYGFIKEDSTGQEVFVHITGLEDTVQEGDAVTYEVKDGKKGPNAINVRRA